MKGMKRVCGKCGHEQETFPACERCRCFNLVAVVALENAFGPGWRERCFSRANAEATISTAFPKPSTAPDPSSSLPSTPGARDAR